MRIRKVEDLALPVNLAPGDTLAVVYDEEQPDGMVKRHELVQETFDDFRTVDRVAIVDLENGELDALGMAQARGGIVGKKRES